MRMKKEIYDEVRNVVKERLSTVFLPPSVCVCVDIHLYGIDPRPGRSCS